MSTNLYDTQAPKKSTNLSINSDLLRQARDYRINLSKALEQRLVEIIAGRKTPAVAGREPGGHCCLQSPHRSRWRVQ